LSRVRLFFCRFSRGVGRCCSPDRRSLFTGTVPLPMAWSDHPQLLCIGRKERADHHHTGGSLAARKVESVFEGQFITEINSASPKWIHYNERMDTGNHRPFSADGKLYDLWQLSTIFPVILLWISQPLCVADVVPSAYNRNLTNRVLPEPTPCSDQAFKPHSLIFLEISKVPQRLPELGSALIVGVGASGRRPLRACSSRAYIL